MKKRVMHRVKCIFDCYNLVRLKGTALKEHSVEGVSESSKAVVRLNRSFCIVFFLLDTTGANGGCGKNLLVLATMLKLAHSKFIGTWTVQLLSLLDTQYLRGRGAVFITQVHNSFNTMDISKLLTEEYLKKFRVFHEVTLFPPNWENLKQNRCPICSNKLKFSIDGKTVRCNGKKHRKQFFLRREVFDKISS